MLKGTTSDRRAFFSGVVGNDSGNPCFVIIGNERIFLYATHVRQGPDGASGGPHTTQFSDEIKMAIDSLSDSAGMLRQELEYYDFSGYEGLQTGDTP